MEVRKERRKEEEAGGGEVVGRNAITTQNIYLVVRGGRLTSDT
jgi:hypothetical protein